MSILVKFALAKFTDRFVFTKCADVCCSIVCL